MSYYTEQRYWIPSCFCAKKDDLLTITLRIIRSYLYFRYLFYRFVLFLVITAFFMRSKLFTYKTVHDFFVVIYCIVSVLSESSEPCLWYCCALSHSAATAKWTRRRLTSHSAHDPGFNTGLLMSSFLLALAANVPRKTCNAVALKA